MNHMCGALHGQKLLFRVKVHKKQNTTINSQKMISKCGTRCYSLKICVMKMLLPYPD